MTDTLVNALSTNEISIVAPADVVAVTPTTTSQEFEKVINMMEDTMKSFREQITTFKKMKKELVSLEKNKTKRRPVNTTDSTKRRSGFVEPMAISDELCEFFELEKGSKISRSEVTSRIGKYVRAHNLKQADNGRNFLFNDTPESKKFESILNKDASNGKPLGYFSLQACLNHHYPAKAVAAVAVVSEAAPAATPVDVAPETPVAPKATKKASKTKETPAATEVVATPTDVAPVEASKPVDATAPSEDAPKTVKKLKRRVPETA